MKKIAFVYNTINASRMRQPNHYEVIEYSDILILSLESDRANKRIAAEKDIFKNFYYYYTGFYSIA